MDKLDVFFDGDCPICRFEVAAYKRWDRDGLIVWQDITRLSDAQLPTNRSRDQLLGKFHTVDAEGTWHIGVDAFSAIWKRLPVFKNIAWIFHTPVLRQIAELAYRGFLRWQSRNRRKRLQSDVNSGSVRP